MSKEIIDITQIDEGGQNPRTNLFEKPLWELHFINGEKRILGKVKMEEYISKAFAKTLHHFNKKFFITNTEKKYTIWVLVFQENYEDVNLSTKQLREKLYIGHQRRDEEKLKDVYIAKEKQAPQNPALFTNRVTTTAEKEEINDLRKKLDPEDAVKLGLHLHDHEKEEMKEDENE